MIWLITNASNNIRNLFNKSFRPLFWKGITYLVSKMCNSTKSVITISVYLTIELLTLLCLELLLTAIWKGSDIAEKDARDIGQLASSVYLGGF